MFAVLSHGRDENAAALATTALHAAAGLDAERSLLYCDLILSALGPATRTALEELMKTKYEYQSDFAKKYFSRGVDEGRDKGREQGIEQGREEGARRLLRRLLQRLDIDMDEATAQKLDAASVATVERIAEEVVLMRDRDAVAEMIRQQLSQGPAQQ